jgi:hypothetical protein
MEVPTATRLPRSTDFYAVTQVDFGKCGDVGLDSRFDAQMDLDVPRDRESTERPQRAN